MSTQQGSLKDSNHDGFLFLLLQYDSPQEFSSSSLKQWEHCWEVLITAKWTDSDWSWILKPLMTGRRGSRPSHDCVLIVSVFKYDTILYHLTAPSPLHLRTVTNYSWTPTLCSRQKGGSDNCTGKFAASLWRALHFSGCDELLCSHFNSQHHIIGHHLGLSFLFSSSIPLPAFPAHLHHMCYTCTLIGGSHTSVVNPRHFPERLCNVIMRTNWLSASKSSIVVRPSVRNKCVVR